MKVNYYMPMRYNKTTSQYEMELYSNVANNVFMDIEATETVKTKLDTLNSTIEGINHGTFETGLVTVTTSEQWPFNTATTTVSLVKVRKNVNYIAIATLEDGYTCGNINIKSKLVNGFKIEVENCPPTGVKVKYIVYGGMK